MPFRSPVDVANRALDHIGAARISLTSGFTENSIPAKTMSVLYDMLRRAELRGSTWKFSIKKAVLRPVDDTTMIIAPALWSAVTSYRPGALVIDEGNQIWISNFPDNLNNSPGNSFFWDAYNGPMTCEPWDSATTYHTGELVYTYTGDGTFKVFLSLLNSNTDNPNTATAYDATATYRKDQVVTYSAVAFMSLIDLNKGNAPSATPAAWAVGTTYAAAAQAYGTNGYIYTSVQNGNLGHDPVTDNGTWWTSTGVLKPWTNVFTGGTGSAKWLEITPIALTSLFMSYPVGAGPRSQSATKNIYMLPSGFLRLPSQDPKTGMSPLGGPSGATANDWLLESEFIVTSEVGAIALRFVADIQDVTKMDDLFCEGLAAKMGEEGCEKITQSTTKRAVCKDAYKTAMDRAKLANAIDMGPVDADEDEYISVRA